MDVKQEVKNRGVIYSVDKLVKEINKTLIKEYDNLKLKNELKEEFASKGLNPGTVNMLISGKKSINQLTEYEKIALAVGCYKIFDKNNNLDVNKYFPERVIKSYKKCHLTAIYPEIITLRNFQKKNDDEYVGIISYKDIFENIGADLFTYEVDIQRQPEYKMLGNKPIISATINDKAVRDIKDAILKDEFEDTQIVLTFLLDEDDGEDFKFMFEPKFGKIIGDITIQGELKINDGMHRCLGICDAVIAHMQSTGEYLDGSISARIVRGDSARARRITAQSFKRSATNIDWLKGFEDNDTNKFVDELIKLSKVLKGNTAKTYDDYKALKKLTYRTLISDVVDKLQINVSDRKEFLTKSKKMAEYLDALVDMINKEVKDDNNYEYVYSANMFIAYLYFAYEMSNRNEELVLYENMIGKVLTMTDKDKKHLKLNVRGFNIKNTINYFKDVFEV